MNQLSLFGSDDSGKDSRVCSEIFYDKFDLTGRRCKRFKFNGEWYYVLVDYALTMGFRDTFNAQEQIDPEEVTNLGILISSTTATAVVPQLRKDTILTTRCGLYQLAYKASRPFRVWVHSLIDESLGVGPKKAIDGKIIKEQKRLGSDFSTAKERVENKDLNKGIKSPYVHKAIWRGITGMSFSRIKEEVGSRPLDRTDAAVLCVNNLAKHKIRLLGCGSRPAACQAYTEGIRKEFLAGSSEGCKIGISNERRKGKTVPVISLTGGVGDRELQVTMRNENGEQGS